MQVFPASLACRIFIGFNQYCLEAPLKKVTASLSLGIEIIAVRTIYVMHDLREIPGWRLN
jgi:hypothetical protein